MEIDISQPVLSKTAIAQKRSEISKALIMLDSKKKWVIRGSLAIFASVTDNLVFVVMTTANAAFIFAIITYFDILTTKQANMNSSLQRFDYTKKEACLQIREWLSDPAISMFHRSVLDESRSFTVGEVEAMRYCWALREERVREINIEKAYNDFYVFLLGRIA